MTNYVYTDVKCSNPIRNEDGNFVFKGNEVEIKSGDIYKFDLIVYKEPRETQSGYIIPGQVVINGESFGLFKNERGISGTLIKGKLWINLKKSVSLGDESSYKVTFVEKQLHEEDKKDDSDLPF